MSVILLDPVRWPHIGLHEIACGCSYRGCKFKTRDEVLNAIDPGILDVFEEIREKLGGKPIRINSAVRCKWHQEDVGNSKCSPHVPRKIPGGKRSYAIDLSIVGHFSSPMQMRDLIRDTYPDIRIGWMGYQSFVHIDMAYKHPNKNSVMRRNWRRGAEW